MPPRNRSTLKNFFKKGSMPSESHFGDLIDSMLNMKDEGFDKTPDNGLQISPEGEREPGLSGLVSFCGQDEPRKPLWSVDFDRDGKETLLTIGHREQKKDSPRLLTLHPGGTSGGMVGINQQHPRAVLDVGGVAVSLGRIGGLASEVKANREWHDITTGVVTEEGIPLRGCHAFEVIAGVGKKGSGMYALMHAFALNAYNPPGWFFARFWKKNIKYHQAYYRSPRHKLKLRWNWKEAEKGGKEPEKAPKEPEKGGKALDRGYCLEIRSNSDYGKIDNGRDIMIRYYITQLWFDPDMSECWSDK